MGRSPQPTGVRGYHPRKTFGILYVIWCILTESGGSYLQAACNFALKIEPICQLQCPRDCTAVLPLLSNEYALKSGTFGVPGLVLWGAAPHGTNPGNPGRVAITPENFWNSIRDLVHFDAIWWQLFVGRRTRYICNFAIKN